mmetsp:Transcript_124254/g.247611  ORF Transcript_124254/g.247611 Transcript_124254/m.247611 type:complete len:634 (-) Transcript_124254:10-1911(-)
MQWLTSAVVRARERGGALVQDGKSAVREGASKVRATLRATPGTTELAAHLEQSAQEVVTATAIDELCHSWVRRLHEESQNPGGATFRRALLQSRAVHVLIDRAARDTATLRRAPPGAAGGTAGAGFFTLLARLAEDPTLPAEFINAAAGGLLSEHHIVWLTRLWTAIQADWQEEVYRAERTELVQRAERVAQDLQCLDNAGVAWEAHAKIDVKLRRQVELSAQLMSTYGSLQESLEDCNAHQREADETKLQALAGLIAEVKEYSAYLQGSASEGIALRHEQLRQDLQATHDSVQEQLRSLDEECLMADQCIEELEARKRDIRAQLDAVAGELQVGQVEQRRHMELCHSQHSSIDAIEAEFRSRLRAEDTALASAQEEQAATARGFELAGEASGVVAAALAGQIKDLEGRQQQFDAHFCEILRDHLQFEAAHIENLIQDADSAALAVRGRRSKDEMLRVMDVSVARSTMDPSESRRFIQSTSVADAAGREFVNFVRDFGWLLTRDQVAASTLRNVVEQHAYVQQVLAPCRDPSDPGTALSGLPEDLFPQSQTARSGVPSSAEKGHLPPQGPPPLPLQPPPLLVQGLPPPPRVSLCPTAPVSVPLEGHTSQSSSNFHGDETPLARPLPLQSLSQQ